MLMIVLEIRGNTRMYDNITLSFVLGTCSLNESNVVMHVYMYESLILPYFSV